MAYCWKCGSEVPDDAIFCYKCGSSVRASAGAPLPTGLELLRDDRNVQNHWVRRLVAVIIDVVIVSVAIAVISFLVAVPFLIGLSYPQLIIPAFPAWWGLWFGGVIPFLLVLYFVLAEALWGRTIGKEIMGLRVVRVDGKPLDVVSSFVRNISKIHVLLIVLDVALGLGMHGEMSQKFSDRFIGTKVESVRHMTLIR